MKSLKAITKRVVVGGAVILFLSGSMRARVSSENSESVPGLIGSGSTVSSSLNSDQDHVNIFISVPIVGHNQKNKKKKKQDSQDHDAHDDSGHAPDNSQDGDDGASGENSALLDAVGAATGLDSCEKLGQALTGESSTQAFWLSIVKGNSEYKKAAQKAGVLLYRASQVGGAFMLMRDLVLAHQQNKDFQNQRDNCTPGTPGAAQLDTGILFTNVIKITAFSSAIALLTSAFNGCK